MFQFLISLNFFKSLHCHLNLFMYSNYKIITQIVTVTVFAAMHFMTVVKNRSMSSVSLICRSIFHIRLYTIYSVHQIFLRRTICF